MTHPTNKAGAEHHRDYRCLQHAKRFNDNPKSRVARATVAERIATMRALWEKVFKG